MPVSLYDAVHADASSVRKTRDGYLVADVRMARSGIYHYAGAELGDPSKPMVRVYRPEDEVFKPEAMASFAHRPMTNDHPREQVTADNWKMVAVGHVGGDVVRDGEYVRVPLTLMDKAAIEDFEAGKRELSAGYTCDIEWSSGTLDDGTEYDAVQRNIRGNHLALVDRGRAGPECRIGDGKQKPADGHKPSSPQQPETEVPLRKLVIDGISVEFSDQGAEAVTKLQAQLADATKATDTAIQRAQDAEKAHKAAIEAKDGQIAALTANQAKAIEAKDGEIAALKAAHDQAIQALQGELAALRAQTSDEAVEARVAARAALVAQAKRVLGDAFDPAGKTDAEIRKAAVVKMLGDKLPDADSKGDEYFRAAFDTLALVAPAAAPARPDPLRQVIAAGAGIAPPPPVPGARMPAADADPFAAEEAARQRMIARDLNAWKSTPNPEAA